MSTYVCEGVRIIIIKNLTHLPLNQIQHRHIKESEDVLYITLCSEILRDAFLVCHVEIVNIDDTSLWLKR